MDINDLTIGQAREIAALVGANLSPPKPCHPAVGKYCVIRTYSAGVHCGVVEYVSGKEVKLFNARRIWSWTGAFTLSTVAKKGVQSAKMPDPIDEIYLTEAIEILPCTVVAENQLKEMTSHE